ncbi:conserved hypothetical protein [Tenacibaculum sp. 190524A02b]|uniref:TLDc domain-containing protein n=1 Tax=Tenacibaculum vairaonense TaxID=3137860 RepID=A0ABM9PIT5_9FLAO
MNYCNNNEKVKIVKKIYIYQKNQLQFGLTESLKKQTLSVTSDISSVVIMVIPETVNIDVKSNIHKSGKYWSNIISVNVLDTNFSTTLEDLRDKKVVVAVELFDGRIFIYGNNNQPLTFSYKELNASASQGDFGYKLNFKGKTTTAPRETNFDDFNSSYFLSSWIAHDL